MQGGETLTRTFNGRRAGDVVRVLMDLKYKPGKRWFDPTRVSFRGLHHHGHKINGPVSLRSSDTVPYHGETQHRASILGVRMGRALPQTLWVYRATVQNVVDGDTVDLKIDVGFYMTATVRTRLLGVNCPEVHGLSKQAGLISAAYTRDRLLGKSVVVETHKSDDFGRWLSTIWVDGVNHNADLVEKGYAVVYMLGPEGL